MTQTRALVLLSGGLDSMLAARILMAQNIDVVGVSFASSFFNAQQAEKSATQLGIPLHVIDISREELELVKNPPHGYGKNMNPCIDCHGLMVRKAKEIMLKEKCHIIATGEVLGQRPMSQNLEAMNKVSSIAGVEVLRPLSAKKLLETSYEKEKYVTRGKLLGINGRSRHKQIELAEKYNIKDHSSPAGGCLLTDIQFSNRLVKMLDYWPQCQPEDVVLLKYGRIFWFKDQKNNYYLVVVGRHEEDNNALSKLAKNDDFMLELKEMNGPNTIVRNKIKNFNKKFFIVEKITKIPQNQPITQEQLSKANSQNELIEQACILTGYFAPKARNNEVIISIN